MRIAIVAYDFPPLNSGGSQRPYFLAKFLKSQNSHVTVFTLKREHYPPEFINYEMDEEFSSGNTVIRTDLKRKHFADRIFQSYYFNLVDRTGADWRNALEKSIQQEHAKNAFDYLLFTCPPFSLATLGVSVSKKMKIPLILDLRDAWSQWVSSPYATYFHYRATLKLEREALRYATLITHPTQQQKKDWLKLHPKTVPEKFVYVPNGFMEYKESSQEKHNDITIFYSGSFYYNPESDRLLTVPWYKKKPYQYLQHVPRVEDWKYRSPFYFFRILHYLVKKNPDSKQKITIRFAGRKPDWFDSMVSEFDLQHIVVHLGFLDKSQIETEMQRADYFLATSAKIKGGRDINIGGKTYEYFSYKKPIIGVVCEGEQKDILNKSGISIILNPDEPDAAALKLESFFLSNNVNPDWNFIETFKVPNNYNTLLQTLNNL